MIEIGLLQRYFNERLTELGISNPNFFALIRSTYGQDRERIGRDPVG